MMVQMEARLAAASRSAVKRNKNPNAPYLKFKKVLKSLTCRMMNPPRIIKILRELNPRTLYSGERLS